MLVFSVPEDQVQLACVLIWGIWRARNDLVWQNTNHSSSQVSGFVRNFLHQWIAAQEQNGSSSHGISHPHVQRWAAPPIGFLKINVDAALFPSKAGLACVIRDSRGVFIQARLKSICGKFSLKLAEALAIREALSWLKRLQIDNVLVETDALVLVQDICANHHEATHVGLVTNDCKLLLYSFQHIQLLCVKRLANYAAHRLAKAADSVDDYCE